MNRRRPLAGCLILAGLTIMLVTFRIATAPGFIAMLGGASLVAAGIAWFVVNLLRTS